MIELSVKVALAYLLGTVMGGLLIAKLRGVDLRAVGSGNIGATNALRTQGTRFALGVLLIDLAKGVVAVTLIPALPWPFPQPFVVPHGWIAYLCALAVALGHVFPFWAGFRGGKGIATLAGVFLALTPVAFVWVLLGFALTIMLTGYVSLASLLGGVIVVIYVGIRNGSLLTPDGLVVVLLALLVVFTHRHNLKRLLAGNENRFEKAMVLRRWRKP